MTAAAPPVLSIDVGTSAVRAAVVECSGRVRLVEAESTTPAPEVDAEAVWRAVSRLTQRALAQAGPVRGVACAAQLGLVLLGADGLPTRPAITWMDTRAQDAAQQFNVQFGKETLFARCGRWARPELIGPKLRWLADHESEALANAVAVISLKDYLVYRLTGQVATDCVHASYTLLFDINKQGWDGELAAWAGFSPALLPPVRWSAEVVAPVSDLAAQETGIQEGVPVAAGGPDGTVGAVGLGLIEVGDGADTAGTSDVIFGLSAHPRTDRRGRVVANAYVVPGVWALGGPTTTTGGCLTWLATLLEGSPDSIAQLMEEAAAVPPGAEGLVVLPDLVGGRTPDWNERASGVFFGLRLGHARPHLVRAVLEAAAYVERDVLEAIAEIGEPIRVVRVGGGAGRSGMWQQIRADVTGVPHMTTDGQHATLRGAAILAATGSGYFSSVAEAVHTMVGHGVVLQPDASATRRYNTSYRTYRALRRQLDPVFAIQLAEIPAV